MMMLSTLSTDTAASVERRIAHDFAASESRMPCSFVDNVPSFSAYTVISISLLCIRDKSATPSESTDLVNPTYTIAMRNLGELLVAISCEKCIRKLRRV